MTDLKLTRNWYLQHDACPEGYRVILRLGLLDLPYTQVIAALTAHNEQHCINFINTRVYSEQFVREHGKIITMKEHYKVFDPLLGQHIECTNMEQAKQTLIEVCKKVLEAHGPKVMQVLENEHGDHAWIPTDLKINFG